jgi:hypothetical protein
VTRRSSGRGWRARALALGALAFLAACATPPKSTDLSLRPSPQQPPTHQVVGESIVAALGGADVTVGWLPREGVERFYAARQGLANPFTDDVWTEAPPTVFALRIRNTLSEPIQFDPAISLLSTEGGRRLHPMLYDEIYEGLVDLQDSARRLQSLQATLLDRLMSIPPGGQREGIIVFRPFDPRAKQLTLELTSLYVAGKLIPAFFAFQVDLRQPQ